MRRKNKNHRYLRRSPVSVLVFFFLAMGSVFPLSSYAQNGNGYELDGDVVEYSMDGNVVTAEGNVVVVHDKATLYADRVEFHRDSQFAYAEGNVRLVSEEGEITGESLTFSFETLNGEVNAAKINYDPYYGAGRKITKIGEKKIIMHDGYLTTSDFDKPEYRIASKRMELYPGEKMVARHIRMMVGDVPLMYLPKYTQSLIDRKSTFNIRPGYDKEWGAFLLTDWRFYSNENLKGNVHLDYRDRLGLAEGLDVDYNTEDYGDGILKLYYTKQRKISSEYSFEEKPTPTPETQRYKIEWRHRWKIDEQTNAIGQYYKISDREFLKDFFESEFDEDTNPDTFFLLTRVFPKGIFSLRSDVRVNRFESKVERLPEIRYDLPKIEIGDSNVYVSNTTTLSNLANKSASPSESHTDTKRVDVDTEFSYPTKISFIEFKPFVGRRVTYYTESKAEGETLRQVMKAGASLSTKFYRIFNVQIDQWGMKVDRLRHIITPSIDYSFVNEPTVTSDQLDQFDAIDSIERNHQINFSLENKIQTKRNGQSVDLLRTVIDMPFALKEDTSRQGFNTVSMDTDFRPTDWLTLYFDTDYDMRRDRLQTANFDLYINGPDNRWGWGVSKRLNKEVDDIVTTEFRYRFSPKWKIRFLQRWDVDKGKLEEHEYTLTRDLHTWIMDMNFNHTEDQGSEIWVIFTLKAFPDMATFDFGTSFNRPKRGSQ